MLKGPTIGMYTDNRLKPDKDHRPVVKDNQNQM